MMKGPFPGMDPYLDARWSDVHVTLIGLLKEVLQPALPSDLRARSEERIVLENVEEEQGFETTQYRGDVAVVEVPWGGSGASEGAVGVMEPVLIELPAKPVPVERYVTIIDVNNGNRIVTVLEILIPWNKAAGRLNQRYRKKLRDFARGGVNLVEIDLLRRSRAHLTIGQEDLPPERREAYLISLRRVTHPGHWEVYPASLRRPLPKIPVPLRPTDRDVLLDLQPLIERVYVAGGHDDIDYRQPADPPLEGADAAWADSLLREAGRRVMEQSQRLAEVATHG